MIGVELVNAALAHLGMDPLSGADAVDSSLGARLAARLPRVRDAVLRTYQWNFAEHIAALPAVALPVPQFGFKFSAPLPAGLVSDPLPHCLRLIEVDTMEPWAVKGRTLYHTGAPPLTIRYVKRVEDPDAMDPLCFELIAGELALAMSNALGTSEVRRRRGELRLHVRELRSEARRVDATEASPRKIARGQVPSWVRPRVLRGARW